METSSLPVKGLKFLLLAIEQGGLFSVPYLLWHGTSAYDGHLRGPMSLTLALAFSSGAFTTYTCLSDLDQSRLGFEHPSFRMRNECSNRLHHRRGLLIGKWCWNNENTLTPYKNHPKNWCANFNQTCHRSLLDKRDSCLFKWRAFPLWKGR